MDSYGFQFDYAYRSCEAPHPYRICPLWVVITQFRKLYKALWNTKLRVTLINTLAYYDIKREEGSNLPIHRDDHEHGLK